MASGKQLIIERILRDRAGIWDQIIAERDLPKLILRMLLCSAISLAAYGAVLGASNGWLQALVSTVKLPLLFLVTLAICLPTLYLFNLVFGARLSVLQACALIMVAITVTAVLTFAFAPISLFFLITARSYAFFKLLNVAILALTALVGLRFLTSGMRALNKHVVVESMLSNQVVVPAPLHERELVSATVGGAADLATQPPTNGDAPTAPRNQPEPEPDQGRRHPNRRWRAADEHAPAVHLDPAVRFRRDPARLDPAPVLRQPWQAVRAVPRHRRHVLRQHPEHAGQSARLTPRGRAVARQADPARVGVRRLAW